MRLEGGRYGREGRVEVCNNDWWGQLCENGWDDRDAAVVCRQLDLLSGDTGTLFLSGSGLIPVNSMLIGLVWTALKCPVQN